MKELIKKINKSKRVAIIAHDSPDPDCLSSMTALSCILTQLNKTVKMFVDCEKFKYAYSYYNLPSDVNAQLNTQEFDTIITVDVAQQSLMGKYAPVIENHDNILVIDHHANRSLRGNVTYVDSSMSSCSEIIFKLAKELKVTITPQIASYVYAGILGDTNCFQNDNTNANTMAVAGECIKYGAEKEELTFLFQKRQTLAEVELKKIAYENMVIKNDIAYVILTKKMFKTAGVDETGNFVNEMLYINDNKFAFVIKQKEKNIYSVSFRCKKGYDVSKIANLYGGGGHVQASGAGFVGAPVKHAKEFFDLCMQQISKKESENV